MTAAYTAQYRETLEGFHPLSSDLQVRAGLGETAAASFRFMRDEGLSTSRLNAFEPLVASRQSAIAELTGDERAGTHRIELDNPRYQEIDRLLESGEISLSETMELVASSERAKRALSRDALDRSMARSMAITRYLHAMYPDRVQSDQQIAAQVKADLAEKRTQNQRIMSRGSGAGILAGTAAGALTDPVVLATLPIGLGEIRGAGVVGNALKALGSEFLIGAASESLIQGEVFAFKRSIESPYTKLEAAVNVLAAGLGAGVLRAVGSAAVDTTALVRAAMAESKAAKVLAEAGLDPVLVTRLLDEAETRAATKPAGVTLELHSSLIDRGVDAVSLGRLADTDELPLPTADGIVAEREAALFIEERQAELLGLAGEKMSRGDRKALDGEIKDLQFKLEQASGKERLQALVDAEKKAGTTGRKAKDAAARTQAEEVKALEKRIASLEQQRERDNVFRKAEADLSRIEQARRQKPDTEVAKSLGYEGRTRLRDAIRELAGNHVRTERPHSPVIPVERVEATPEKLAEPAKPKAAPEAKPAAPKAEPKPKVKKGEPVAAPVEAPPADLPDVPIAVAERADGTPDIRPASEVVVDINKQLSELDMVESCLLQEAA